MVCNGETYLPFGPVEVKEGESYIVDATRSFIAVPRADFQTHFKCSPTEAGYPETDCVNELGQTFKGVLMVNPWQPYMRFDMSRRVCVQADHFACHRSASAKRANRTAFCRMLVLRRRARRWSRSSGIARSPLRMLRQPVVSLMCCQG